MPNLAIVDKGTPQKPSKIIAFARWATWVLACGYPKDESSGADKR